MESEKVTSKFYTKIGTCRSAWVSDIEVERRALHEEIEIKCFYAGKATLMIGDEVIDVAAGDVVVVNPYEFHATLNIGQGEDKTLYHLFMIPLDVFTEKGNGVIDLRTLLLKEDARFETLYRGNRRLCKILMRIAKEYAEKEVAYDIAIGGLIMELFAVLIREGFQYASTDESKKRNLRKYRLIEPALGWIRDHFQENISLDQLAELCHLSKSYFCRVFKTVTQKPVMEYLNEYRLKVADAMLRSGKGSITYIAGACGFESSSYFCRIYKRHFGFKPSERR